MKKYILGIIFGIVATFPWVLVYFYMDISISLLTLLIVISTYFGYKIFSKENNKKIPAFITIVPLLITLIVCLFIFPIIIIYKEGLVINFSNLLYLYNNVYFKNAIFIDLLIAIIFVLIGVFGIIINAKYESSVEEVNENNDNKIIIKEIFNKYNAFNKQNAIDKKIIDDSLTSNSLKQMYNTLRMQMIIKKTKKKYYYSLKADQNIGYQFICLYFRIFILLIMLTILFFIIKYL